MAERSAAPEFVLETDTGSTRMTPVRDYHVGRDPLCDIVIDDARVSWHHAVLRPTDGHWTLQDEHSTNGTYADGQRVAAPGTGPRARLAAPAPPAPELLSAVSHPALTGTYRRPAEVRPLPARTIRVGRSADNDLVLDDLVVSRRHAELRALPDGGYEI